jgi:hypothetical protein
MLPAGRPGDLAILGEVGRRSPSSGHSSRARSSSGSAALPPMTGPRSPARCSITGARSSPAGRSITDQLTARPRDRRCARPSVRDPSTGLDGAGTTPHSTTGGTALDRRLVLAAQSRSITSSLPAPARSITGLAAGTRPFDHWLATGASPLDLRLVLAAPAALGHQVRSLDHRLRSPLVRSTAVALHDSPEPRLCRRRRARSRLAGADALGHRLALPPPPPCSVTVLAPTALDLGSPAPRPRSSACLASPPPCSVTVLAPTALDLGSPAPRLAHRFASPPAGSIAGRREPPTAGSIAGVARAADALNHRLLAAGFAPLTAAMTSWSSLDLSRDQRQVARVSRRATAAGRPSNGADRPHRRCGLSWIRYPSHAHGSFAFRSIALGKYKVRRGTRRAPSPRSRR